MGKDFYTSDGRKISIDESGKVYDNGKNLGHVDKNGNFHSSQYGQSGAFTDYYGNILDSNGNKIGQVDGNKIITNDSPKESSSSSVGGCSFIFDWIVKLIFSWKFWVIAWVLGMIFCIITGDAPWD